MDSAGAKAQSWAGADDTKSQLRRTIVQTIRNLCIQLLATYDHLPWCSAAVLIATLTHYPLLLFLVPPWCLWYFVCMVERPRLLYNNDRLEAIIVQCSRLRDRIYHTPWAWSGHAQATLFALWPQMQLQHRVHKCSHNREMLSMKDGGQIALDWCSVGDCSEQDASEPEVIVLILPGMVGKSGNPYITRIAQFLHGHRGPSWRCVVKSWRGIGCPLAPSQPRSESWDGQSVQDTIQAAEHIRRLHPHSRLVCVGFSHGGNICLGALAHAGESGLFDAGVCVSAPYDLEAAMTFLEKKQWFPYAFINVKSLVTEYVKSNATLQIAADLPDALAGLAQIDSMLSFWNLATHLFKRRPYGSIWHEHITRKYTGHDTVQKYYSSITDMVQEALPKIRTPVLCLLSEDDPVTPFSTFKRFIPAGSSDADKPNAFKRFAHTESSEADKPGSASPWVSFVLTKRGGHCGWFYRMRALSWVDEVALEFLQSCLNQAKVGK